MRVQIFQWPIGSCHKKSRRFTTRQRFSSFRTSTLAVFVGPILERIWTVMTFLTFQAPSTTEVASFPIAMVMSVTIAGRIHLQLQVTQTITIDTTIHPPEMPIFTGFRITQLAGSYENPFMLIRLTRGFHFRNTTIRFVFVPLKLLFTPQQFAVFVNF